MYYIYAIHAKDHTGRMRVYIGSRTTPKIKNVEPEKDLFVNYFSSTSDEELKQLISEGKATAKVLRKYDNQADCWNDEQSMIRIFWKLYGKENSWNYSHFKPDGEHIWGLSSREKMSKLKKAQHKEHPEWREEFIKRISGKNNYWYGVGPMKGRKPSQETCKIISEKRKQYIKDHPEEIAEANKKISEALKKFNMGHPEFYTGQNNPAYSRRMMNNYQEEVYVKPEKFQDYIDKGYTFGTLMLKWQNPDNDEIKICDKSKASRHWKGYQCLGPATTEEIETFKQFEYRRTHWGTVKGKRWMNNKKESFQVPFDQVQEYLDKGYVYGFLQPKYLFKKPDGTYEIMDKGNEASTRIGYANARLKRYGTFKGFLIAPKVFKQFSTLT